jgi:hypothetical protein
MGRDKNWFRFYNRMIGSPQVVDLNDSEFRLIVSLWCLASESDEDGRIPFSITGIRRRTMPDHSEDEVKDMVRHLQQIDLLTEDDNGYLIPRWSKHQYEYDSKNPKYRREQREKEQPPDGEEENNPLGIDGEESGKSLGNDGEAIVKVEAEADTDTDTEKEEAGPASSFPILNNPDLTQKERELLQVVKSIRGYPFEYLKDLELLHSLEVDFPKIDLLSELKKYQIGKLDKPLKKSSNPRLQIRNWIEQAEKWRKERTPDGRNGETFPQKKPARAAPSTGREEKYKDLYIT